MSASARFLAAKSGTGSRFKCAGHHYPGMGRDTKERAEEKADKETVKGMLGDRAAELVEGDEDE